MLVVAAGLTALLKRDDALAGLAVAVVGAFYGVVIAGFVLFFCGHAFYAGLSNTVLRSFQRNRMFAKGYIPEPGGQIWFRTRVSAEECRVRMAAGLTPVPDGWTWGTLTPRQCERLLTAGYLPNGEGGWEHRTVASIDHDRWQEILAQM